jgi:hypothetical protein
MPTMTLIDRPAWAHPFERSVDQEFGEENWARALALREAIMAIVQQATQDYIDDPLLTSDKAEQGFPSRDKLTGEYYISHESYWVNDEPWFPKVGRQREYRFSFMVHCLEHLWHENQVSQDYLGLDVHFDWIPEEATFRFHGDVDSSVI